MVELTLWLSGMSLLLTAICAAVLGCFGAEITEQLTLPSSRWCETWSFPLA